MMKMIDNFFYFILYMQRQCEALEKRYIENLKWVKAISVISCILMFIFINYHKILFGSICFFIFIIFISMYSLIGWRKSVRRWLNVGIEVNMFLTIFISCVIRKFTGSNIFFSTGFIIILFGCIWMVLSLIADSKVSKLVNEVVASISTVIFTVGTYLIGLELSKFKSIEDLLSKYFSNNYMDFEMALQQMNPKALEIMKIVFLDFLQQAFIVLLPVIGISTICIMLVDIKEYWLEKNQEVGNLSKNNVA